MSDASEAEPAWRRLETRARHSFFQSWTWTGCLAQRFDRPVLAELLEGGRTTALALFNRSRRAWHLGEAGDPARDSIFIEHNGPLAEPGADVGLLLRTARRAAGRLAISGADDRALQAARDAGGWLDLRQSSPAPYVDAAALLGSGKTYLEVLSANTRQQLARSARKWARRGPLTVQRAQSDAEAHLWLAAMAALHQAAWQRRGKPGAFANPFFAAFHHALIERGRASGQVEVLRIAAGDHVLGYLHNFVHQRRLSPASAQASGKATPLAQAAPLPLADLKSRMAGTRSAISATQDARWIVSAYQSGFDYDRAERHEKPGLTCHHMAIEMHLAEGADIYDFLAGEDRYKTSMATGARTLHWLVLERWLSPAAWLRRARRALTAWS